MSMYDLIVLGAGPGGYVAAERAGKAGLKTLLIEKAQLGGVCLNSGCIPTKTLLHAAKTYYLASNSADFGVSVDKAVFQLEKAMAWKAKVTDTLQKGIAAMMKRHGVEVVQGEGRLIKAGTVRVGQTDYTGKSIIIATGSSTLVPPIPGVDNSKVLTSTELLNIKELPKSIIIVGGGIIGMEFASFFSLLGLPVTVIEMLDEIVPVLDKDFAAQLRKMLPKITFELGAKVEGISEASEGVSVSFSRGTEKKTLSASNVLLSVGRRRK